MRNILPAAACAYTLGVLISFTYPSPYECDQVPMSQRGQCVEGKMVNALTWPVRYMVGAL